MFSLIAGVSASLSSHHCKHDQVAIQPALHQCCSLVPPAPARWASATCMASTCSRIATFSSLALVCVSGALAAACCLAHVSVQQRCIAPSHQVLVMYCRKAPCRLRPVGSSLLRKLHSFEWARPCGHRQHHVQQHRQRHLLHTRGGALRGGSALLEQPCVAASHDLQGCADKLAAVSAIVVTLLPGHILQVSLMACLLLDLTIPMPAGERGKQAWQVQT